MRWLVAAYPRAAVHSRTRGAAGERKRQALVRQALESYSEFEPPELLTSGRVRDGYDVTAQRSMTWPS
jgi:hypothetical protein